MSVSDLANVTRTLQTLLVQNIDRVAGLNVTVTPQAPEEIETVTNTLSLHLYHVSEDGYYKNCPGPGNDVPSVATAPMALSLFYILTAHHDSNQQPDEDPLTEQQLMGLALKTLHDFPVITDATEISTVEILAEPLRNGSNNLQIIMRPVSPDDSLSFWSAEDARTARLSAYYEVRVVMLEPEPPRTMPGIVLELGSYLLQLGTPSLTSSRSVVRFTLPQVHGGGDQAVEATPGRPALDLVSVPANNEVELLGTNLTTGISRSLVLRTARWAALDPPVERVVVDPDLNAGNGWIIEFSPDRVRVRIGSTLTFLDGDGVAVDLDVYPGLYSARIETVVDEQVVANELKQLRTSTNEIGFSLTARISSSDPPDGNDRITVNLKPAFALDHGGIDPDEQLDVQLVADGAVYVREDFDAGNNEGRFEVAADSITMQPLFDVSVPGSHPVRLLVEGADAQPFWIEIT